MPIFTMEAMIVRAVEMTKGREANKVYDILLVHVYSHAVAYVRKIRSSPGMTRWKPVTGTLSVP